MELFQSVLFGQYNELEYLHLTCIAINHFLTLQLNKKVVPFVILSYNEAFFKLLFCEINSSRPVLRHIVFTFFWTYDLAKLF